MFACAETIVRPAPHEASPAAAEAAGPVIAAGAVDPCVIDPPAVGDSPPPQAARAAAPMTAGTKVAFTTKTFLRDHYSRTSAFRFEVAFPRRYPPKETGGTISQVTLVMLRDDWWWPWWVSTLIDLGVVAIAVAVFVATRRRAIRVIAATFVLAGLVAAIMAPIVMTDDSNRRMKPMEPDNAPMMSP
jgi:hypothetical protein